MSSIISKISKSTTITFVITFVLILLLISDGVPKFAQPAPISRDDLALGKIYIGDSTDKVVKTHGKPIDIKRFDQNTLEYSYEDITIYFNRHNRVNYIKSSSSNAANLITTPRGIAVGNSVEDLVNVYGKSDRRDSLRNDITGYTYGLKTGSSVLLLFECDSRTNKIVKISLYDAV